LIKASMIQLGVPWNK